MIPTFLEWVNQLDEGFLTPQQREGDAVFFGIHDLAGPIDVRKMGHCISPIRSVGHGHVLVEKPQKTRHRGMKKMMSKDGGLLKLATGSLQRVPDELVIGGDGSHKLYMYMPGDYHKNMAKRLDKKMMAADSLVAKQPDAMMTRSQLLQLGGRDHTLTSPPTPQSPPIQKRTQYNYFPSTEDHELSAPSR